MQIQYTKNFNPGRFELGTTLSLIAEQVYYVARSEILAGNSLIVRCHVTSK